MRTSFLRLFLILLGIFCLGANYSKMTFKNQTGDVVTYPEEDSPAYKYKDAGGNDIVLPTDKPIYSQTNPGPWKGQEKSHLPVVIKSRLRQFGLEDVRIINFSIPHPMTEKSRITRIYILDKDNYVIGYYKFPETAKKAEAQIRFSGVLNYVQVYVQCSEHSLWRTELRF